MLEYKSSDWISSPGETVEQQVQRLNRAVEIAKNLNKTSSRVALEIKNARHTKNIRHTQRS
jgi:hypothetical protein